MEMRRRKAGTEGVAKELGGLDEKGSGYMED